MNKVILLAEDSEYDEFFFRRIFKIAGVRNKILVVRDAREAIAYLNGDGKYEDRKQFPLPDALFLDLVMPGADGLFALKWMKPKREFDETLVVVLSNFSEGRLLRDAYALGADSFLFKPFTQSDLESLIHHYPGYWTMSSNRSGKAAATVET
jgi:CheY-like chemotaxis protein